MRYAIGVPHTRPFSGSFVDSLVGLRRPRDEYNFIRVADLPVDEARNEIVRAFLDHPDHLQFLLMIDSDMVWHPYTLERLAGRIEPGKVDMVSALMFCRHRPIMPSIFKGVTQRHIVWSKTWPFVYIRARLRVRIKDTLAWLEKHPEALVEQPTVLDPPPGDAMYPTDATGAAFTLFTRQVFEGTRRPWFKRFGPKKGEDFYFFQKARHAGYKLWVDRSAIVFHSWGDQAMGPIDFCGSMAVQGVENAHI